MPDSRAIATEGAASLQSVNLQTDRLQQPGPAAPRVRAIAAALTGTMMKQPVRGLQQFELKLLGASVAGMGQRAPPSIQSAAIRQSVHLADSRRSSCRKAL